MVFWVRLIIFIRSKLSKNMPQCRNALKSGGNFIRSQERCLILSSINGNLTKLSYGKVMRSKIWENKKSKWIDLKLKIIRLTSSFFYSKAYHWKFMEKNTSHSESVFKFYFPTEPVFLNRFCWDQLCTYLESVRRY